MAAVSAAVSVRHKVHTCQHKGARRLNCQIASAGLEAGQERSQASSKISCDTVFQLTNVNRN